MTDVPDRLRLAAFLVLVSFVWPFINANYFFPGSTVEVNFLPVFLAVGLAPEALLDDLFSLFLAIAVVAVAASFGSVDSSLRVIIGIVPLLFLMGLYRSFSNRGWELIPRSVAYRALQVFVGFSVIQYINLNIFQIVPEWLTDALTVLVPRYATTPYDEFGIRGVQGWASEPAGAAMTCFAFSVVAIMQEPQRRWRVFGLFAILAVFNKSIYAILLLALLGISLILSAKNKALSFSSLIPLTGGLAYFILHSARVGELRNSILAFGLSDASNIEFFRFAQILYPLTSFPSIYKPVLLYGGVKIEPAGMVPLLVGYGSFVGCLLYYCAVIKKLRVRGARSITFALAAIFMLSFLEPPDFIPAIVAFAYALEPEPSRERVWEASQTSWFARLKDLVLESAAARRRQRLAAGR